MTLHWTGAKEVLVSELMSNEERVCLSLPVVWRGNGEVRIIGLLTKTDQQKKDDKVAAEKEPGKLAKPVWEKHGGIWWLRGPSKFTRQQTYLEIVRFFTSRWRDGSVKLWVDDLARGHNTTNVDNFLKSIGVKRARVLGGTTCRIQPADRPQCNGKLKQLVARTVS